mgnify:CR=1 FL=1
MKRLTIYEYNEDSGVVGEATLRLLQSFKQVSEKLVIVCNAYLTPMGRNTLKGLTEHVYCLNCKNIPQVAFADAMVHYCGIDELSYFDEVTLVDNSFYGPMNSLVAIYNQMQSINCDYWQMFREVPKQRFVVIRRSLFQHTEYCKYMDAMLSIYMRTFQNIGYRRTGMINVPYDDIYSNMNGASYIELTEEEDEFDFVDKQLYLVSQKGYPFLDKKLFDLEYLDVITQNKYCNFKSIIQALQNSQKYDFNLIQCEKALLAKNRRTFDLKPFLIPEISTGKLYIDYGNGYSEKNTFEGYNFINANGDFKIRFSLHIHTPICGFRYDPLEKFSNLVMHLYSCKCDEKEVKYTNNNGIHFGIDTEIFSSSDPYYEFRYNFNELQEVLIEGNLLFVNNNFMSALHSYQVTSYISSIFWNTGNGFNETNKMSKGLFLSGDNEFELRFSCDLKHVKELRLDPLEGFQCRVKIIEVKVNDKEVQIKGTNGKKISNREWIFAHFDPNIMIDIKDMIIDSIYIRGYLNLI